MSFDYDERPIYVSMGRSKLPNMEACKMSANEKQIGGDHYRLKPMQPWDFVAANNIGFFEGNAIKYLARWKEKGGVDDLRKAVHYIEKLIEIETGIK